MTVKYEYIRSASKAEEVCKKLMEARSVGVDTETTGTDSNTDKVTLMSLATKQHGAFVVDTREVNNLKAFEPLLDNENIIKIAHNGIFDYKMILGTAGIEMENIFCTMLGEQVLNSGRQFNGYGLDDITLKYLGKQRDKTIRESFIGHTGEFSEQQLGYAAEDALDLPLLAEAIAERAKADGVTRAWRIECAAIQAFGDMEHYGQLIDKDKWLANVEYNKNVAKEAKQRLDRMFEPVCNYIWDDDGNKVVEMDYDSPHMVLTKLKQMGVSVDGSLITSTNKKMQQKIKQHPVIQALESYRKATHGINQFGLKYVEAIHPSTGRVHFRFKQIGAETGRPASRGGLNCLNIPKDNRYRECFTTDPDRLISTVDFNAAELRILADLCGDPLMLKCFIENMDLHCFTSSMLFGVNVTKANEYAHLRTPGKEINLGLAYGMGVLVLCEKINAAGYKITLDETKELFQKYMDKFRVAMNYLKSQQRKASKDFMMANRNGRRRYWMQPNEAKIRDSVIGDNLSEKQISDLIFKKRRGQLAAIEREGANFPITSVNVDFTKMAMAECRKEFKRLGWGPNTPKGARTYNSIYDEIIYDFHKDFAEEGHAIQKRIMIECANSMLSKVKMQVEGHLGPHWIK
jgi:DNA polymerase I